MATLQELEKLARKVVGRNIEVQYGQPCTDGTTIWVQESAKHWPRLPERALDDMDRFVTGHEAGHIHVFDGEARKRGFPAMSAEEFYQIFADPLSPGADSTDYVRFILNVVEDRLVDNISASVVGEGRRQAVNRFFVWNRQGGMRPSMAELESGGNPGMCAAFIEALFQLAVYNQLVEAYYSPTLERAAKQAAKAIDLYGQGSISRTQALQRVLDALQKYCPPPWSLPKAYQPPRGETSPKSGDEGAGDGTGAGQGSGQGQGSGAGAGDGEGEDNSKGSGKGKGAGEGEPSDGEDEADGQGEDYSETDGGGSGSPSGGNSRGTGTGGEVGESTPVGSAPERVFEDNNLEALLRMLERVLAERTRQSGRGNPRWRTWAPGDQISSPDELERYQEDKSYGIEPLDRRAVRQRQQKRHLLAVFIDSSGSVGNDLFAQLYCVCGELAEKVADLPGCMLGVGQFSGGASWVLEPTRDVGTIRAFAEEQPRRLYSGGTTVGEIYGLLPEAFAGYKTADLVVLTDGYVESGKALAASLQRAHDITACEIKLHGVVFKRQGIVKRFEKAKDELPQFVRVWHLG